MGIPTLSPNDLQQASSIVLQLYSGQCTPAQQQLLQHQLFDVQKRVEAWSLIAPFLHHEDPNVQFFGAHTAQVKISRDWDTLPDTDVDVFRESLLNLTGYASVNAYSKVVLRKLYAALVSLALRLCTFNPSRWPNWVLSSSSSLISMGMSSEAALDYLSIVAEEVSRIHLNASIREATSMVSQAVTTSLNQPRRPLSEKLAALKCFEAWIQHVPSSDITTLVPLLLSNLSQSDMFIPSCNVVIEILSSSSLSGGTGTKILTEPILFWLEHQGRLIYDSSLECESLPFTHVYARSWTSPLAGEIDESSRALCKLLVALGDHSISFIATHLPDPRVQTFLRVFMGFSGFPGCTSDPKIPLAKMTISFWTYFGEALLDADFFSDTEGAQMSIVHQVYAELVGILQRKSRWPPPSVLKSWSNDQIDVFIAYRRDIGEAVLNAYYIIRDETLRILVEPIVRDLLTKKPSDIVWEDVEASLYCVKSAQDAVPLQSNAYLSRLFGALERFPEAGNHLVRQTALSLIGEYATWFTSQDASILLRCISFVVVAVRDPTISFIAASALKQLCDANRTQLAPHIASFAELYASSVSIPDFERAKIIEAISSVIQALHPEQAIAPTEVIVRPVVEQWQMLSTAHQGVSGGVRTHHSIERGRNALSIVQLRDAILNLLGRTMSLWSAVPEIADVLSELIKFITALPSEATLISLPPGPVLELVCMAADRQLTAVWLNLASRLVVQLDPPSFISLKPEPGGQVRNLVDQAAQSLVISSLRSLGTPGAMETNPDLVQAFFACMDEITRTFLHAMVILPAELSSGVLRCAIQSLSLQERYSLVGSCKFLVCRIIHVMTEQLTKCLLVKVTYIKGSMEDAENLEPARACLRLHGQEMLGALVLGIVGEAPRSSVPNLATVLATLVAKLPSESREWLHHSMLSERLIRNARINQATKDAFVKAIVSSRSTQKTLTAANELSLIGRGLNGTSYAAGQLL
ncbi:hypothetical protein BS47DRAFT_1393254 [Hydnum rufescens UP504]|uniref:Exportin-1/Importin-beta-like domain-containing protein n=1 Tax=Hydnum rufescens UP504 TaxID=1448309 RepID=A0A9P6AWZ0_9AGAM|nr:hypothetical protein BS47DRAFT_1393254 [Hydnum rufescens UP504]